MMDYNDLEIDAKENQEGVWGCDDHFSDKEDEEDYYYL